MARQIPASAAARSARGAGIPGPISTPAWFLPLSGALGLGGIGLWLLAAVRPRMEPDFVIYYVGATLARTGGWDHLYDFARQRVLLDSLWPHPVWMPFWNPPPLALLVSPLTWLPEEPAFATWSALMLGFLLLCWRLGAPGRGRLRVAHLLAFLGLVPVVICLAEGQVVPILAAGVVVACVLLRSGHPWVAGIALAGCMVMKPQPLLLVPLALLASGRGRSFASWALTTLLVAAASLAAVGAAGLHELLADLSFARTWTQPAFTLAGVAPAPALPFLTAGVIALTLAVAWRWRGRGPEIPLAAGLVGSLSVTPFAHPQDLVLLAVAGWLALRGDPSPRQRRFAFGGYLVLEVVLLAGQLVLAAELAWLVAMLVPHRLSPMREPVLEPVPEPA